MTPDELKSIPKGQFVVMKTGTHPMQTRLRLFLDWGISFGDPYLLPERAARKVAYASKEELEQAILKCTPKQETALLPPPLPADQRSFQAARSRSARTQTRRSGQLQEERPDLARRESEAL